MVEDLLEGCGNLDRMAVEYDSLPLLWRDLCDAVSGRSTDVTGGVYRTDQWSPSTGDPGESAIVVGGTLTLTIDTPEGIVDLQCEAPADTLTAARELQQSADWWRCITTSGTGDLYAGWLKPYQIWKVRKTLMTTAFPSLTVFSRLVYVADELFDVGVNWSGALLLIGCTAYESITLSNPFVWTGCSHVESGIVRLTRMNPYPQSYMWWINPPDDSLAEALSSRPVEVPTPQDVVDISALNIYSDRMAAAAARSATRVETHTSRMLARYPSASAVTLSDATGTLEDAIRRLADASRAYFQGGLIVQGKREVQVAITENVLVSGKR